jgi:hypothetical protein
MLGGTFCALVRYAGRCYAAGMIRRRCGISGWISGAIGGGILLVSLAGCQRQADVTLYQRFAPRAQQELKLIGDEAYVVTSGDEQTCLLMSALPNALRGPRAFVLYFRGPNVTGRVPVDPNQSVAVRGFLVQEVGALAGRTDFAAGSVTYRDVPFRPGWRNLVLDVRCEDGTEIRGKVIAESGPAEVRAYERRHAPDVATLSPATQPAEGQPTHTRASTSP